METAIETQVKASELRLGNVLKVKVNDASVWLKVKGIADDSITLEDRKGNAVNMLFTALHYVKPIPLTPGLLVKCGFERIGEKVFTNEPFCFTMLKEGGFFFSLYGRDLCVVWYLHRLQNLIFELTSEDLEVSL